MLEAGALAAQVDAGHEAAELAQQLQVVELRRAAAEAGVDGEAEGAPVMERPAVPVEGRGHRDFLGGELQGEVVLLLDGRVGPAAGPVELGDHRRPVLDADPVHPVLVAVQRQQAAVAAEAEAFHRGEDVVGRQVLVGEGVFGGIHGAAREVLPAAALAEHLEELEPHAVRRADRREAHPAVGLQGEFRHRAGGEDALAAQAVQVRGEIR